MAAMILRKSLLNHLRIRRAIGAALVVGCGRNILTREWPGTPWLLVFAFVFFSPAATSPASIVFETRAIPLDDWHELISINLNGVFYCCKAVIPLMLQSGSGSIINISSIAGLIGHYPGFSMLTANYSSAKAGLIGMTRQMAVEYAKDNIRANAIAPGWHGGTRLSERNKANLSNQHISNFEENILQLTPMGRRGLPDELGGLALYLASDASSYLTGQVITQDGGWTAM